MIWYHQYLIKNITRSMFQINESFTCKYSYHDKSMRYTLYVSKSPIPKSFHLCDFKGFKWSSVCSVWNKFDSNVEYLSSTYRSWSNSRRRGQSGCIDGWTKGFLRQWVVSIHVVRPDSWLPRSLRHRSTTTTCSTNNRTISSFFCFIFFPLFRSDTR